MATVADEVEPVSTCAPGASTPSGSHDGLVTGGVANSAAAGARGIGIGRHAWPSHQKAPSGETCGLSVIEAAMLSVATTKFDYLVFLVAGRLTVSVQVSKVDACATNPQSDGRTRNGCCAFSLIGGRRDCEVSLYHGLDKWSASGGPSMDIFVHQKLAGPDSPCIWLGQSRRSSLDARFWSIVSGGYRPLVER